jgi:putative RNA 2'-phosphotransferase
MYHSAENKPDMNQHQIKTSKFLSLILRHRPGMVGLQLDDGGWVAVDELLAACAEYNRPISHEELLDVVTQNDKQRFIIRDGRIRASQGHSIKVKLDLEPRTPPEFLYHGTIDRNLASIQRQGLLKRKRHHVHLSPDVATATRVGARRGKPVVLRISAETMHQNGHLFYQSENGVWLTDHVPPQYLTEAADDT